jgi:phosphatidylinositol alpha 1,6-mannosyltransferase
VIKFTGWLDIQEFKEIIANADIFIHPARFDSYGGTTLGMALGVPVIGSMGAGAAVDRIKHGVNGFLYEPTDTKALSIYIARLLQFAELRHRIGEAGRQTAMQWHPSRGVDIITEHSI